jgi:LPS-assembly protein
MFRVLLLLLACVALEWLAPTAARAQVELAGCTRVGALQGARIGTHTVLTGTPEEPVQIDCKDMQFFADSVELFNETNTITATGHVLFVSTDNRISAERMEFNWKSKTGTFYTASGTVTLGGKVDRSLFGTQEPDAYFYGETVEKLGPTKYKISRGGFTTCVQPTPRWELVAGSVTLNLDDYALLTNAVFKIKGVPMMYLPVFYYPIQEDDRATGFLIPTYGTSTGKGQTISNAFFWAIGRSHDATFTHDWLSKAGSGMGGEYRYVLAPGSSGNARVYRLSESEVTVEEATATNPVRPALQSYDVRGNLTQRLPLGLFARANADYTSRIETRQRYQQDVAQATNRTRRFGGQITGAWNVYSLSATAERNDIFYQEQDTIQTIGALPRISFSRGEGPIAGLPIYFGLTSEYAGIVSSTKTGEDTESRGLTRMDVTPSVRVPFTRWPFLTVNSSLSWRGTRWSESQQETLPDSNQFLQVPEPIGRSYFDFTSRITGPVFNRIFNTPGNGYAEKFKHVIEPTLTIQRVTAIDNLTQIVRHDSVDTVIGGTTTYRYALANRLYAKKESSREILTATVSQSYYTVAAASQVDPQQQGSHSGAPPSNFSNVTLQIRGAPSDRIQVDFRTDWHPTAHALLTLAASGTVNLDWVQAQAGWSQRRLVPTLPGYDNPDTAPHYLRGSVTVRRPGNWLGGAYNFDYDIRNTSFLQQRYMAYYNAQCCGVALEYQTFNFVGNPNALVPQDRRFNVSFSLAGIGSFSNFFGALGGAGQQNR